jgi:hypothetical protein
LQQISVSNWCRSDPSVKVCRETMFELKIGLEMLLLLRSVGGLGLIH